jgi:hypothetical protein
MDGVADCCSDWGEGGFAHARWVIGAVEQLDLDGRDLVHAHDRVIVEITLLYDAFL